MIWTMSASGGYIPSMFIFPCQRMSPFLEKTGLLELRSQAGQMKIYVWFGQNSLQDVQDQV
jgi:hypothetical protein